MNLQRRHFEFIASTLKSLQDTSMTKEEHHSVCRHFAFELQGANPNFNWDYFMVACGAQEGTYRNKSR